jgi:hypothetical protein
MATLLNTQVPLSYLAQITKADGLPENLRRNIAPAVWARAAFLDETEIAVGLVDTAIAARPELKPYLESYLQTKSAPERKFVAAFTVLHFPGLRPYVDDSYARTTPYGKIDDYADNWWCNDVGASTESFFDKRDALLYREEHLDETPVPQPPAFLNPNEKARAEKEWSEVRSFGPVTRYLPQIVVTWAHQHPDDSRVPEALHLAVRATRYGCDDGKPSSLSHTAFSILHKNYPGSEWARKTPYWY